MKKWIVFLFLAIIGLSSIFFFYNLFGEAPITANLVKTQWTFNSGSFNGNWVYGFKDDIIQAPMGIRILGGNYQLEGRQLTINGPYGLIYYSDKSFLAKPAWFAVGTTASGEVWSYTPEMTLYVPTSNRVQSFIHKIRFYSIDGKTYSDFMEVDPIVFKNVWVYGDITNIPQKNKPLEVDINSKRVEQTITGQHYYKEGIYHLFWAKESVNDQSDKIKIFDPDTASGANLKSSFYLNNNKIYSKNIKNGEEFRLTDILNEIKNPLLKALANENRNGLVLPINERWLDDKPALYSKEIYLSETNQLILKIEIEDSGSQLPTVFYILIDPYYLLLNYISEYPKMNRPSEFLMSYGGGQTFASDTGFYEQLHYISLNSDKIEVHQLQTVEMISELRGDTQKAIKSYGFAGRVLRINLLNGNIESVCTLKPSVKSSGDRYGTVLLSGCYFGIPGYYPYSVDTKSCLPIDSGSSCSQDVLTRIYDNLRTHRSSLQAKVSKTIYIHTDNYIWN